MIKIKNQKYIDERVGQVNKNNAGHLMTIIEYKGVRSIDVLFENGYIVKNRLYKDFLDGRIKMPMTKTVFGHGIIDAPNLVFDSKNNKLTKMYSHWNGMLERCYDEKLQKKHPTYIGCKVINDWLYLSNFNKWFIENYYEIPNSKYRIELDKDILSRHYFGQEVKIYSPETACFVPRDINLLLCKRDSCRGDYPIGVTKSSKGDGFVARLNIDGVRKYLGYFHSVEDAFLAYKNAKEKEIKRKANLYKEHLPKKVYDALINYEVKIND